MSLTTSLLIESAVQAAHIGGYYGKKGSILNKFYEGYSSLHPLARVAIGLGMDATVETALGEFDGHSVLDAAKHVAVYGGASSAISYGIDNIIHHHGQSIKQNLVKDGKMRPMEHIARYVTTAGKRDVRGLPRKYRNLPGSTKMKGYAAIGAYLGLANSGHDGAIDTGVDMAVGAGLGVAGGLAGDLFFKEGLPKIKKEAKAIHQEMKKETDRFREDRDLTKASAGNKAGPSKKKFRTPKRSAGPTGSVKFSPVDSSLQKVAFDVDNNKHIQKYVDEKLKGPAGDQFLKTYNDGLKMASKHGSYSTLGAINADGTLDASNANKMAYVRQHARAMGYHVGDLYYDKGVGFTFQLKPGKAIKDVTMDEAIGLGSHPAPTAPGKRTRKVTASEIGHLVDKDVAKEEVLSKDKGTLNVSKVSKSDVDKEAKLSQAEVKAKRALKGLKGVGAVGLGVLAVTAAMDFSNRLAADSRTERMVGEQNKRQERKENHDRDMMRSLYTNYNYINMGQMVQQLWDERTGHWKMGNAKFNTSIY